MTAPTNIQALVGVQIYISATLPDTYDAAGYQSTDFTTAWTEITKLGNIGNHGLTKSGSDFTDVSTGVVTSVDGAIDYGTMSLVFGYVQGDTGQQLLKTASEARNTHYSIKLEYDDGDASVTDEIHFFDVLVRQFEFEGGEASAVRRINSSLRICKAPVIVAPT